MKRCVLGLAVLVLASVMVSGCGEGEKAETAGTGEKVLLRLRLEEGKVYLMRQEVEQHIVQEIQGREMALDQTLGFGFSFKITKVNPDGTMTADAKYESVKFKQKGSGLDVEYDSTKPSGRVPPTAAGFAALVGERSTWLGCSE